MRYKGTAKPVSDIGKELGVGTILEGSVRKTGNKVRITAQLIHAQTEEHLWSQSYDRDIEDVFSIQSEIAQKIARALKVRVLAAEKKGLGRKATDKPDAYTSYLRGRHFLNSRSEEGLKRAIECFQQALAEDPGYAKAYAGLADSHAVMALLEFLPPRDVFPKARKAAQKALEIDGGLAEAHTSIGAYCFSTIGIGPGQKESSNKPLN